MNNQVISIRKAKEHNLKSIDIDIPKNTITVITGPSGSGKSSLAFDTIYVEGQRRYIESLSAYARQFLGQFQPPDVESITGLSPAVAIDQKSAGMSPRSTVGTVTEIHDYLRVFYARLATPYCPDSQLPMQAQNVSEVASKLEKLEPGTKLQILAPIVSSQKGEHREILQKFFSQGYNRVYLNDVFYEIGSELYEILNKKKNQHNSIDLIIDRLSIKGSQRTRLAESIELAFKLGNGIFFALVQPPDQEAFKKEIFSEKNVSPKTGKSYPDLSPRMFSFNSPLGACNVCNGLGRTQAYTKSSLIFDSELSIDDGAIPLIVQNGFLHHMVDSVLKTEKISNKTPLSEIPDEVIETLFNGSGKIYNFKFSSENSQFNFKKSFPGIVNWLFKKYSETTSDRVKASLEEYMSIEICKQCKGKRLNPYALSAKVNQLGLMDLSELSIKEAKHFLKNLHFEGEKKVICEKLSKEILTRLTFLEDVGLHYLSLSRPANTLSGGEAQRIRLATQIGSGLSGVIYVLDEPSIGLHQKDNLKLINTLTKLRDLGNTVIVVEHDEETMLAADYLIDMGPGAGASGGEVVDAGSVREVVKRGISLTSKYLSNEYCIPVPMTRRTLKKFITLRKVNVNNLVNFDVKIPVGGLIAITGVSGSGKSSLVHRALVPGLKSYINKDAPTDQVYHSIQVASEIDSLIILDQSAIGRTPKSNLATYTGLFNEIRELFSATPEARARGFKPGRFSFNVKGGRCEGCEGSGVKKIEMHFLSDVYITCDQCGGARYNPETLDVLFKGKSIADVLSMTVSDAKSLFQHFPKANKILNTLEGVGLSYMQLGQSAPTLSGGEAQRLKLSKELSKNTKGHCIYILDEPTTGLHIHDIKILLKAFQELIELGHTVMVIEHNLDVIKVADHIIDLGPEGGVGGGKLVAQGTPEEVAQISESWTGKFLKTKIK